MKKFYKKAELEVIEFEIEDVITTSDGGENPDEWGDGHDVVDDE